MTTTTNARAIALAGITVLIAGSIAVVNTISQGYLFEMKKAIAAIEAAKAESEKAKSMVTAAESAAHAAEAAARLQSNAVILAAQQTNLALVKSASLQSNAMVTSTEELVRAENGMFDQVTRPMFSEPASKIANLNERIIRLRRETASGIDRKTRLALSDSQLAEKTAERLGLEEELATLQETTGKNWNDSLNMMLGTMTNSLSGMSTLYPQGQQSAPLRRINQEQ